MHSRTLYQTESLELLRLNYHHLNATFLDMSAQLLLGYVRVRVNAASSTLTVEGVTNVCPDYGVASHSVAPPARHN